MPSSRLKVLLSAYAFVPGDEGEAGVGWDAARALARLHDVWVLTPAANRGAVEARLRESPVFGLRVHAAGGPAGGSASEHARWQRVAVGEARALHADVGFDVVHHVTCGSLDRPSRLHRLGLPFVAGPLMGGEAVPPAFLPDPQRARWGEGAGRFRVWASGQVGATRQMVREADVCFAVTDETTARLQALGARRVVRIPAQTGLTADDLRRLEAIRVEQPETPRFVTLSQLIPRKGISLALRALARSDLAAATLDVIGDGPERLRLEAEAAALGLGPRVRFRGALPRREALALLARSTALVHPALLDTSPKAVLEAMSLGKPVIALCLNGMASLVTPETGIPAAAPDPETAVRRLASGMRLLARDPALRHRLGVMAVTQAHTEYTWAHKAALFDEVYRQVVRSGSGEARLSAPR